MDYFLTDNRTPCNTPSVAFHPSFLMRGSSHSRQSHHSLGAAQEERETSVGNLSLRNSTSYLNNIFIVFCKQNSISQHSSLFSDKWAICKAYPQSLPCEQLAWSLKNKPLQDRKCPFLFFSLLFFQNKSSWIEGIFKWQPGPVCGCNISILNKGLFKGLKHIFFFHLIDIPQRSELDLNIPSKIFHIEQQILINPLALFASCLTGPISNCCLCSFAAHVKPVQIAFNNLRLTCMNSRYEYLSRGPAWSLCRSWTVL